MRWTRIIILTFALCAFLGARDPLYAEYLDESPEGGTQYVFATTRGLNEMDLHPAFKVTALPVAIVLDLAFLPFALIADVMT